MRVFLLSLLGFVLGTVASYFAIMIAYSVYVDVLRIHDQDGGGAMTMGLLVAPVLAFLCGGVTAILSGIVAARPEKRG